MLHCATRHADLDVLALPAHWSHHGPALAALSYDPAPNAPSDPTPGRPVTLAHPSHVVQLAVWLATPTAGGAFALDLPAPRLIRLILPPDIFSHPPTTLATHTLSPLALYLLRAASALNCGTLAQRRRDRAVTAHLRHAFLSTIPGSELQPHLISL